MVDRRRRWWWWWFNAGWLAGWPLIHISKWSARRPLRNYSFCRKPLSINVFALIKILGNDSQREYCKIHTANFINVINEPEPKSINKSWSTASCLRILLLWRTTGKTRRLLASRFVRAREEGENNKKLTPAPRLLQTGKMTEGGNNSFHSRNNNKNYHNAGQQWTTRHGETMIMLLGMKGPTIRGTGPLITWLFFKAEALFNKTPAKRWQNDMGSTSSLPTLFVSTPFIHSILQSQAFCSGGPGCSPTLPYFGGINYMSCRREFTHCKP